MVVMVSGAQNYDGDADDDDVAEGWRPNHLVGVEIMLMIMIILMLMMKGINIKEWGRPTLLYSTDLMVMW